MAFGPFRFQADVTLARLRLAAAGNDFAVHRELHDAVNQTLWTAALTADSLLREAGEESPLRPRLERLRQLTRGALAEMRTLVLELRPAELSEAPPKKRVRPK